MPMVSLKAHFDGQSIQLDEPFDLPANSVLMVTILPSTINEDRELWVRANAQHLARAYGDNEPEYTTADLKP